MKRNIHGGTLFLILLCLAGSGLEAQDKAPEALTLARAIAVALEHHPSIRSASAFRDAAQAGVTQNVSAYYPVIGANAGYTHNEGWFVFNPSFPPRQQIYNSWTAGISAQQLVFDFGRTINRVSSSGEFLDAARNDFDAAKATVVADAEIAYFACRQAGEVLEANQYAVDQAEKHLAQAKAFFTVGSRPQIDVTRAEVDLANAQVGLIRARNQVDIARAQLDNALGVRTRTPYNLTDSLAIPAEPLSLDALKAQALKTRPELLSAQSRLEGERSLVSAARSQHLPSISATGNYSWNGFDFPLYSRWNAALTVSVPLFQGFAIDGQVRQAEANMLGAQAALDAATDGILLEVEQAFLSLQEAGSRLGATDKLVQQASENALLTERQYVAGTGTPLEASDAQLVLLNARNERIQAVFDYNSAYVRLQRATGRLGKE